MNSISYYKNAKYNAAVYFVSNVQRVLKAHENGLACPSEVYEALRILVLREEVDTKNIPKRVTIDLVDPLTECNLVTDVSIEELLNRVLCTQASKKNKSE